MSRFQTISSTKPTIGIRVTGQDNSFWDKNCNTVPESLTRRSFGKNVMEKFAFERWLLAIVLSGCSSIGDVALCREVVVPVGISSTGGNSNDDGPLGIGILQRAQYVFGSSHLGSIDPGDQIIGLSFRVDEDFLDGPLSAQTISNYDITLSTSANAPALLDPVFTKNLGADSVLVKRGELTISDGDFPTGDVVNGFGASISFDVPFTFSSGPLLIDITHDGFPEGGHWVDAQFFESAEPDVAAIFGRGYQASVADAAFNFAPIIQLEIVDMQCDVDVDGVCDALDFDALSSYLRSGGVTDAKFDLNSDGMVNHEDLRAWVHDLEDTWFGDANLDGEFNSGDLVAVFQAREYEDDIVGNSGWATGDWNGDAEFDTGDLVWAFQDGGFEQGRRQAVNTVPEPNSILMLMAGFPTFQFLRRKTQNRFRSATLYHC